MFPYPIVPFGAAHVPILVSEVGKKQRGKRNETYGMRLKPEREEDVHKIHFSGIGYKLLGLIPIFKLFPVHW